MGNIKEAGIWALHPPLLTPGVVIGTVRCKVSIDLREDSSTASQRVNMAANGQRVGFDAKRLINGEIWYRTVHGDWLFALYVAMDDSALPFV